MPNLSSMPNQFSMSNPSSIKSVSTGQLQPPLATSQHLLLLQTLATPANTRHSRKQSPLLQTPATPANTRNYSKQVPVIQFCNVSLVNILSIFLERVISDLNAHIIYCVVIASPVYSVCIPTTPTTFLQL